MLKIIKNKSKKLLNNKDNIDNRQNTNGGIKMKKNIKFLIIIGAMTLTITGCANTVEKPKVIAEEVVKTEKVEAFKPEVKIAEAEDFINTYSDTVVAAYTREEANKAKIDIQSELAKVKIGKDNFKIAKNDYSKFDEIVKNYSTKIDSLNARIVAIDTAEAAALAEAARIEAERIEAERVATEAALAASAKTNKTTTSSSTKKTSGTTTTTPTTPSTNNTQAPVAGTKVPVKFKAERINDSTPPKEYGQYKMVKMTCWWTSINDVFDLAAGEQPKFKWQFEGYGGAQYSDFTFYDIDQYVISDPALAPIGVAGPGIMSTPKIIFWIWCGEMFE